MKKTSVGKKRQRPQDTFAVGISFRLRQVKGKPIRGKDVARYSCCCLRTRHRGGVQIIGSSECSVAFGDIRDARIQIQAAAKRANKTILSRRRSRQSRSGFPRRAKNARLGAPTGRGWNVASRYDE